MEIIHEKSDEQSMLDTVKSKTLHTEDTLGSFFEDAKPPNDKLVVHRNFENSVSNEGSDSKLTNGEAITITDQVARSKNIDEPIDSKTEDKGPIHDDKHSNNPNAKKHEALEVNAHENKTNILSNENADNLNENVLEEANKNPETRREKSPSSEKITNLLQTSLRDTDKKEEHENQNANNTNSANTKQIYEQHSHIFMTDTEDVNENDKEQTENTSSEDQIKNADKHGQNKTTYFDEKHEHKLTADVIPNDTHTVLHHDDADKSEKCSEVTGRNKDEVIITESTVSKTNTLDASINSGKVTEEDTSTDNTKTTRETIDDGKDDHRDIDYTDKENVAEKLLPSDNSVLNKSIHYIEKDTMPPTTSDDDGNHIKASHENGTNDKLDDLKTVQTESELTTGNKFDNEISPPLINIQSQNIDNDKSLNHLKEKTQNLNTTQSDNINKRPSYYMNDKGYEENSNENKSGIECVPPVAANDRAVNYSSTILKDNKTDVHMSEMGDKETFKDNNKSSIDKDHCKTTHMDKYNKQSECEAEINISSKENEDTADTQKLLLEHSLYFTGRLPSLEPCDEVMRIKENETETDEQMPNHGYQENTPTKETGVRISPSNQESKLSSNNWAITNTDDIPEDEKSTKSTSTSVKDIQNLIREINAPSQMYQLSKEEPLTPKNDTATSSILKKECVYEGNADKANEPLDITNKSLTINDVNQVTTRVIEEDIEKHSEAKYDDLPHMKKISEYTDEMKMKTSVEKECNKNVKPMEQNMKTSNTITDTEMGYDKKYHSNRDDTLSPGYEIEQTAKANQQNTSEEKTSHSETDLKEMIASAKKVIEDHETVLEDRSGFNTTTITSSSSAWRTIDTSQASTNDGLICSRCLSLDTEFATSGFCHDCQEYLCGKCKLLHHKSAITMDHYVTEPYCTNELKVKKYIRATAYCKDCEIFLCGKCTMQHTGFRAFRRHRIIQSSFISRQAKSKATTVSTTSLNTTGESCEHHNEQKKKETLEEKKRKKHIENLMHDNLYRMNSSKVSESLYPGPNKKLAVSYTRKPHWPYSSIPTLPYLVKPGSMHERALKTPYLNDYKTPFYSKSKHAFEPKTVKMKALQSRYISQPTRKSLRRREAGLYTARPLRSYVGDSLPDLTSVRSYNMGRYSRKSINGRNEDHRPKNITNLLKKAEYLRDECLSIPFPSNELQCVIAKLEVMLDGRLVVLDKRNNNIKLYSKSFDCKAVLGFQSRLVDMCPSNTYPTDIYVATPKHIHEVSAFKGMEVTRKVKVEIKRIEGIVCWKYGIGVVFMKDNLSWELRLLDYRGNLKSKLEILNPFTCEIEKSSYYHVVPSRGGKYVTLSDKKNACAICVDVTTRCVVSETQIVDSKRPGYLTSDHENNIFVSCGDEIQQISAKGQNLGKVLKLEGENKGRFGCIVYNISKDRLYVQIEPDVIAIYKMKV